MTSVGITFIVSSLGIIGMILMKLRELKTGKLSLLSRISERTNHSFRNAYRSVKTFFSYFTKRNAVLLARFLLVRTILFLRKIYLIVKNKIMSYETAQKLRDMINGKGVIKKKGAVSFFLQRIAEEAKEAHNEVRQEVVLEAHAEALTHVAPSEESAENL